MARIFISYKRVDKDKVFKIKDQIESALGEKCWIDLEGIESDARFKHIIINAINESEIVLFMYSKAHSQIVDYEKDWTLRELNFAEAKNKRIVFINIDGSPLTDAFRFDYGTKQQVDGESENSINNLIRDLGEWNDKKDTSNKSENILSKIKKNLLVAPKTINILLWTIQLIGFIALIPNISGFIWSLHLLGDNWTFSRIYGKGFIPGLLLNIIVLFSNYYSIQRRRRGFYLLVICSFLTFIPTIYNEYEEFLCFSGFTLVGILAYFILLNFPQKGISVWKQCNRDKSYRNSFFATITCWLISIIVVPFIMAQIMGFENNMYDNGLRCLDARFSSSPYYSNNLANKYAKGDDCPNMSKWERKKNAEIWFKKSLILIQQTSDERGDYFIDKYVNDYISFLIKTNQQEEAERIKAKFLNQ